MDCIWYEDEETIDLLMRVALFSDQWETELGAPTGEPQVMFVGV